MDYFFDRPTQVAFYNVEDGCYDAGIAEGDHIICLSCGGVLPIQDLLDEVEELLLKLRSLLLSCIGAVFVKSALVA